jgi:hypothetical protein
MWNLFDEINISKNERQCSFQKEWKSQTIDI